VAKTGMLIRMPVVFPGESRTSGVLGSGRQCRISGFTSAGRRRHEGQREEQMDSQK
jgi:hypothetical protein